MSPQQGITAALLHVFPLGTHAKCILTREKQHFFLQDPSLNDKRNFNDLISYKMCQ